jgi:xanthine dehydrogenase accessory factor
LSTRSLTETFKAWSTSTEALVLVTVVATEGSTYSKAGRQLLLQPDGKHAGLVSGGCLEGDLAAHSQRVFDTGEATLITYDMRDDADDLWGIGLGCNGMMQLLLQKISATDNWSPFKQIATALADSGTHSIALITTSDDPATPAGTAFIDQPPPDELLALTWQTQPWVRLLVLGAAPDAEPVVRLARQLGWVITVADHRPGYLEDNDFSMADNLTLVEPGNLKDTLEPANYSAIVIMSHHLETDGKYLGELANYHPAYTGLLGPVARKQKLLEMVDANQQLVARLHGPVGLEIGADSPESIALALISEIQSVIAKARPA